MTSLENFLSRSHIPIETDMMTAEASNLGKDAPKTPEKTAGEDGESPFRALREELGLARVATPALRPRRSTDPFVLRLRPEMVRSEENLMTLALTPAEATAVRDRQAAQVLSQCMDETLTLKEALWYLEWADWNVELAILQQMHDHIDRNEAPKTGSVSSHLIETARFPNTDSHFHIRYKCWLIFRRRIQTSTEILR